MQVHRCGNQHIRTHQLADANQKITFGIIQSLNAHSTVNIKKDAIQGKFCFQAIQRLSNQRFVCFTGYNTARHGMSAQGRQPNSMINDTRIGKKRIVSEYAVAISRLERIFVRNGG
ncbi:hypothetical protein SDC9_89130 [bioreactor metagenome]|uniref:Uncharacterized protein n=1 Tax=bioreactor metagenome TaxID=1076179 RepID=A0A644ZNI5_9ZZZZ